MAIPAKRPSSAESLATISNVVLGAFIMLAFLSIVLSDDEALTPAEDCYQRLLRSGEQDEMELVDNYLKTNPMSALFDSVLMPVVAAAGMDHRLGFIDDSQLESVEHALGDIVDAVSPDFPSADDGACMVCCVPARAQRDQLAGEMLVRLLRQQGISAQNTAARMPLGELVASVRKKCGCRLHLGGGTQHTHSRTISVREIPGGLSEPQDHCRLVGTAGPDSGQLRRPA